MESPFLTAEELAQVLRVPVQFVKRNASYKPELLPPRFNHPGKKVLWHRDDVTAWIEAGRTARPSPRLRDCSKSTNFSSRGAPAIVPDRARRTL